MISSTANLKVKQVVAWQKKAKARETDGVYLVEGFKMFEEAPEDKIIEVYVSETAAINERIKDKLQRTNAITVSEEVFKKMSDTQSPQGILTCMSRNNYSIEDMTKTKNPLIVVLENLQDPGNLGTIIRTGEGAGITGIIMSKNTVDIYNPKTIRATMGSIYRVPFAYTDNLHSSIQALKDMGVKTYAAHLKGQNYYSSFSFTGPTAFLIGNEGNGLTDETAKLADSFIKIPMEGKVESLNAAIATSLLIYEAHRQRKQ